MCVRVRVRLYCAVQHWNSNITEEKRKLISQSEKYSCDSLSFVHVSISLAISLRYKKIPSYRSSDWRPQQLFAHRWPVNNNFFLFYQRCCLLLIGNYGSHRCTADVVDSICVRFTTTWSPTTHFVGRTSNGRQSQMYFRVWVRSAIEPISKNIDASLKSEKQNYRKEFVILSRRRAMCFECVTHFVSEWLRPWTELPHTGTHRQWPIFDVSNARAFIMNLWHTIEYEFRSSLWMDPGKRGRTRCRAPSLFRSAARLEEKSSRPRSCHRLCLTRHPILLKSFRKHHSQIRRKWFCSRELRACVFSFLISLLPFCTGWETVACNFRLHASCPTIPLNTVTVPIFKCERHFKIDCFREQIQYINPFVVADNDPSHDRKWTVRKAGRRSGDLRLCLACTPPNNCIRSTILNDLHR